MIDGITKKSRVSGIMKYQIDYTITTITRDCCSDRPMFVQLADVGGDNSVTMQLGRQRSESRCQYRQSPP